MLASKVCKRLKAAAALRLDKISLRYGLGGESGPWAIEWENQACSGTVQRRQRRQTSVERKVHKVGDNCADDKLIFKLPLRFFFCRETTTPPPRPKQTFSLPKLKTPASPKLPIGRPSMVAPNA